MLVQPGTGENELVHPVFGRLGVVPMVESGWATVRVPQNRGKVQYVELNGAGIPCSEVKEIVLGWLKAMARYPELFVDFPKVCVCECVSAHT